MCTQTGRSRRVFQKIWGSSHLCRTDGNISLWHTTGGVVGQRQLSQQVLASCNPDTRTVVNSLDLWTCLASSACSYSMLQDRWLQSWHACSAHFIVVYFPTFASNSGLICSWSTITRSSRIPIDTGAYPTAGFRTFPVEHHAFMPCEITQLTLCVWPVGQPACAWDYKTNIWSSSSNQ